MYYLTQSIHRNAQTKGNHIATIMGDRQRTWLQVKDRIARFAGGLKSIGVQNGDRIAILALNSDSYFEYYFSVPWAGAVVVPLNIRWSPAENAYSLKDSGATVLLVDQTFAKMLPAIEAQGVSFKSVIFIGDSEVPKGMIGYENLIANNEPAPDAYRGNEDLAGIYYTGGTTGFPKGVMLSHSNMWASAMASLGVGILQEEEERIRYLHAAPMFHLGDGANTQVYTLAGSTHVFIPMFTPSGVIKAIAEKRVTNIMLVPTMIQMIINDPLIKKVDVSSLEFIAYGASPMSESLLLETIQTFPKAQFLQGYGQTELAPMATLLLPKHHATEGKYAGKMKTVGQAAPCVEIKIVNEEGQTLASRAIGEIAVKGPNCMLGYWNKPEETAVSLRNGWVHTGDAGYMDEDGFLFLVDRIKDMIISGGENVYSAEVENAVVKHPAVDQVVVIGIPHKEWGEQVHAEVILKAGQTATAEEIIADTKTYIANYKCPRSITFRTEPFPLSGAGKVLKREVKKGYWVGQTRQIH